LTTDSQLLGPDAVRSQAVGIGVTWLRSLYTNQVSAYGWSRVICSVVGLTTLMFDTFAGKPV
jgi:hypothetical protein